MNFGPRAAGCWSLLLPRAPLIKKVALDDHAQPIDNGAIALVACLLFGERRIPNMPIGGQVFVGTHAVIDAAAGLHMLWALDFAQIFRLKVERCAFLWIDKFR